MSQLYGSEELGYMRARLAAGNLFKSPLGRPGHPVTAWPSPLTSLLSLQRVWRTSSTASTLKCPALTKHPGSSHLHPCFPLPSPHPGAPAADFTVPCPTPQGSPANRGRCHQVKHVLRNRKHLVIWAGLHRWFPRRHLLTGECQLDPSLRHSEANTCSLGLSADRQGEGITGQGIRAKPAKAGGEAGDPGRPLGIRELPSVAPSLVVHL